MTYPEHDEEYQELVVTEVKRDADGDYSITLSDGCCIGIESQYGVTPRIGDIARFYGKGFGSTARGIFLNGIKVFYRTAEEEEAARLRWLDERKKDRIRKFETEGKARLDADYEQLCDPMKRRIDKFRRNNPDFRWEYEDYEMFCCKEAQFIADALLGPWRPWPMEHVLAQWIIRAFRELSCAKQMKRVPNLSDDHSGNSFGIACHLAYLLVTTPGGEGVVQLHGALAALVGSEEYGCIPRTGRSKNEPL